MAICPYTNKECTCSLSTLTEKFGLISSSRSLGMLGQLISKVIGGERATDEELKRLRQLQKENEQLTKMEFPNFIARLNRSVTECPNFKNEITSLGVGD